MSGNDSDIHEYGSEGDDETNFAATGQQGGVTPNGPPDSTSLLVELTPEEFPTYFSERDERLFASNPAVLYPLPVDTPEQQRLDVQHTILKMIIGANYVGPVPDILNAEGRLAVDLGTGNGKWVLQMAREFPQIHFRGVDIVPIATRFPPSNVRFEMHDAHTPFRWDDNAVDVVHARDVSMAFHDYPAVLREAGRILRSDGLFLSGEWGRPAFHPALPLHAPSIIPAICHFYDLVETALGRRGIQPITTLVPSLLAQTGLYENIIHQDFYIPVGPWLPYPHMQRLGRAFRASLRRFADSVKPLLLEDGIPREEVEDLIESYLEELKTIQGLVTTYHTVHARRV